ncbi:elongation factor 4, partial [Candidatus Microgenomates bacterium]|nr:elongation factor 4 [Candidatus Microgenomates bacterium]
MEKIRNFCIIAHIDHGKSTLADRLLEATGTITPRQMRAQLLDTMDLERERGITIKLQPVRMHWQNACLNLIDTPGHVDFTYEVSRSLAACEGALLVVDASQGVQAQTLANVYLAIEAGLTIIPVINKIDLPAANIEKVAGEICQVIGCQPTDIFQVSAKTGEGVEPLLQALIERVPAPGGEAMSPLRALVFDSIYDEYRGVILYVRVVDGQISKNDPIRLMGRGADGLALEIGHFAPSLVPDPQLVTGQIGYIVTNLKSLEHARVGDTVTSPGQPAAKPLVGYREVKPFVFAGVFPLAADQYPELKDAVEKLKLNDAALIYQPENSPVLGHGYRIGLLGLLHLEIIKERLEREYGLKLVITNPSTEYHVDLTDGTTVEIHSASELPDLTKIAQIREPWIKGELLFPAEYTGSVIQLINQARGAQGGTHYIDQSLVRLEFEAPLSKILTDFYDRLKGLTSGYGSFSYELADWRPGNLVKLDILVAGEVVDSLSTMVHKDEAESLGRRMVEKLKEVIPRQLFEVSVQAAIGTWILAREDIKA